MLKKSVYLFLGLWLTPLTAAFAAEDDKRLINNPDVQAFFEEMETEHGFTKRELTAWFQNATVQEKVLASIQRPAEKTLPWYKYRKIFLSQKRAEAGAKFWQEHADTLAKAEATYGVPASIIVAILGVETYYGKHTGKHRVLDSLATLAFYYPPRAKFFKQELVQFLSLAKEENLNPTELYGSYAGALGTPQFISSSYRQYAVDFDHDGVRNLLGSIDDSIGSVANYFKVHGWQTNQPVVLKADPSGDAFKAALSPLNKPKPSRTLTAFHKLGVKTHSAQDYSAALIELDSETGPEYYLGLQNFYVITRYNHSSLYAMAVYDLSQEIESIYRKTKEHG